MKRELLAKIEGGLWGLLVGDAVGVPYEFHPAREIPPREQIDMFPPPGFSRSYAHVPCGTWSDDGAQALCLTESLIERREWDPYNLARKLLAWASRGYLAADGKVFDIGIQTGEALRRLSAGATPYESGLAGERNNGNGGLMRSLPLALLLEGSDARLVAVAHEQCAITHAHPRSQVCCALYCLWARRELEEMENAWGRAADDLDALYGNSPVHQRELREVVLPAANEKPGGTGYVVDSLYSARLACNEESYRNVVTAAVALGNDTDTTACLAGGIAGIRFGWTGIPAEWRENLRGRHILDEVLVRLRRLPTFA